MASGDLTASEWRVIQTLRELQGRYDNFTVTVFGQGSIKRRILDVSWQVRERLEHTKTVSLAVDD